MEPSSTNCPKASRVRELRADQRALASVSKEFSFPTCQDISLHGNAEQELLVVIAGRSHLFPFRTEQLSSLAPMVLRKWESRSLPAQINQSLVAYLRNGAFRFLEIIVFKQNGQSGFNVRLPVFCLLEKPSAYGFTSTGVKFDLRPYQFFCFLSIRFW